MKLHKVMEWSAKYGKSKSFDELTNGTMGYYNWGSKIGRKDFLKRSKMKSKRFLKKNPDDLNFRVFKSTVLKGKNVSPELMLKFKNIISRKGTVKYGFKFKYLTPKQIYDKMKG